jgi:hypothetical protein
MREWVSAVQTKNICVQIELIFVTSITVGQTQIYTILLGPELQINTQYTSLTPDGWWG